MPLQVRGDGLFPRARLGIVEREVLNNRQSAAALGRATRGGRGARSFSAVTHMTANKNPIWWGLASAVCTALAVGLLSVPTLTAAEAGRRGRIEFNRDIRPILSENCYACHGPDKNKRKAKLRLDERDSALKVQAIVPGKPDESELVSRV